MDKASHITSIQGISAEAESLFLALEVDKADSGHWLYIAQNDEHLDRVRAGLQFYNADLPVFCFPAWDCLPYDRVSPHTKLVSRRLDTLCNLLNNKHPKTITLTTVNAVLQKTMPKKMLQEFSLSLFAGQDYNRDQLLNKLSVMGFQHVDMVFDKGEMAVRGGIIDLFPSGYDKPLRLDFFGDELESIKSFDPISQRSEEKLTDFHLKPVSEVILTPETCKRFCNEYRSLFGTIIEQDPLYESIAHKKRYPGYEHWQPLFYENMSSLMDYLPEGAKIVYGIKIPNMAEARFELINDYFQSRKDFEGKQLGHEVVYHPIPASYLYFTHAEWEKKLDDLPKLKLSPFSDSPDSEMDFHARALLEFKSAQKPDENPFTVLKNKVARWHDNNQSVLIAAYSVGSLRRLVQLLQDNHVLQLKEISNWQELQQHQNQKVVFLAVLPFEHGFIRPDLVVISEKNLLGDRLIRRTKRSLKAEEVLANSAQLELNDYLVHQEHGVGQYKGLRTLEIANVQHDFFELHYSNEDKLFVPVENIDILSRYGPDHGFIRLDKLGGANWQERKARVKKKIKDLADHLLKIAAQRHLKKIDPVLFDAQSYSQFCSKFPYPETDDQLKAIEDVFADLSQSKLMDRLICGDVGFGKTEVALRGAFLVAMSGKQVALLVPTTLLSYQHFQNFKQRFADTPVRIEQMSRFNSAKENKEIKEKIAQGQVDIVIGTHALLTKSISFKDLGLVIIDEEQHFGVSQKERLKEIKSDVHVLTLTATPIPRTLQMALTGVRDLSLITTPPIDRLAVRTFVMPYDPMVIKEAIMREIFRGGQCFYVCPKLKDIPFVKEELTELVPDVKIAIAHGQMSSTQLEDTINAFYQKKFDLLLSTNIVESGLDLPDANTIIIHRSDHFGLSQLYQLRGRVGRSKVRAYAYLTIPTNKPITDNAQKRLEVMQSLDSLGAGFTLASHDLDIRGAGNLLGDEQSGHIREVGTELYQKMLEDAVNAIQTQEGGFDESDLWSPQISLGLPVLITEDYIQDLNVRLSLYRQIANLASEEDVNEFAIELVDRFGDYPEEVDHLLKTVKLKIMCKACHVQKVDAGPKGVVFQFYKNEFPEVDKLVNYIHSSPQKITIRPDQSLFIMNKEPDLIAQYKFIKTRLSELIKLLPKKE